MITDNISKALSTHSDEISVNGGEYTGYVVSESPCYVSIENYDMEINKIKKANINTLYNMDKNIQYKKEV